MGGLHRPRARPVPAVWRGYAPVYTVTAPGFEDESSAALDAWLAGLRRRQYLDLREWRSEGPDALQRDEVRRRLAALDQRLADALDRAERVASSPTTIPSHNPNFVGRLDELRRLHETLDLGRLGTITAVHGLGGIGKSALAFEYAHAFAVEYPGGRFHVPCARVSDLRIPLVNLAEYKGVSLTDDERKDLDAAFARVRAAFESGPRSLLLLDNVDDPALLLPAHRAACLPSGDSVHVLATTRLEPERLRGLEFLALDSLPEPDASRLLERHRPFADDAERAAAGRIVARLGGYPLAIEVVAVYLWQSPEITYAGYAARLEREGLAALEGAGRDDLVALSRHNQTLITELLKPTLALLSKPERLALEFAATLPPDNIVLPWLRQLVARTHPEYATEPEPGFPDPWRRVERRIVGLRLLLPGDNPQVARMHRLLQDVIAKLLPSERFLSSIDARARGAVRTLYLRHTEQGEFLESKVRELKEEVLAQSQEFLGKDVLTELNAFVVARSKGLTEDGKSDQRPRWEIESLCYVAHAMLRRPDARSTKCGIEVANRVATALRRIGRFREARSLLHHAIEQIEERFGGDYKILGTLLMNLAIMENESGDRSEAARLFERGVSIEESKRGAGNANLATTYANRGAMLWHEGNLDRAREWLCRSIPLFEKQANSDPAEFSNAWCSLAMVENDSGNLPEARRLLLRSIALLEPIDARHPGLIVPLSNLGSLENESGNPIEAGTWLRRAISICETQKDLNHPDLVFPLYNLACVEQNHPTRAGTSVSSRSG